MFDDSGEPTEEAKAPDPPLDMALARANRDCALARVDANSDEAWKQAARTAIERLATTQPEFISDAVWDTGLPKPREPRALGPIMVWAARRGLIVDTGRIQQSAQPKSHAMPRRIWRSLIYSGRTA